MKKQFVFLLGFLIAQTAFAQQNLFGGKSIISPEIHADQTVTFRVNVPGATNVQITGDFLPTKKMDTEYGKLDMPSEADLTKGADGIWEFKTPGPLLPELYSYSFIIDGFKTSDPNNVHLH